MSSLAIAVFDSGLGGLTVLKVLRDHFPGENFVYLGDTARLPYGSKSPETIHKYAKRNIDFLLKTKIKAVVVACNSASAALRSHPVAAPVPVFEVIQPGAEAALAATKTGQIGVVGTFATVSQGAYAKCITSLSAEVTVHSQACPLLVPLVEEGWIDDPLTNLVVNRYVGPLLNKGIDTLILGCTHYPILKKNFRKVTGPDIQLIDSGEAIAHKLQRAIAHGSVAPNTGGRGSFQILTTDKTARFAEIAAYLLGEQNIPTVEVVDV
jgi:glutamate racemase